MDIDPVTDPERLEAALAELEAAGDWSAMERTLRASLRLVALAPETHVRGRPKVMLECELWERLGLLYRDRLGNAESAKTVFDLLASRGWGPQPTGLAAIVPALLGQGGPPPSVEALANALGLEFTPEHLADGRGRIELASGQHPLPTPDITSLSVTYAWDMFHEYPIDALPDLLWRAVFELSVGFAHPLEALASEFTTRFGAPRSIGASLVWGTWIAASLAEGRSSLSFYRKLPDWAVEAPAPEVRERALVALAAALTAASDGAAFEAAAEAIPPGAGLIVRARPVPGQRPRLGLEFSPAIGATELARILGWRGAVARTFVFHRNVWEIWLAADATTGGPPYDRAFLGEWAVTPTLDGHPRGQHIEASGGGPIGDAYALGPDEVVRSIRFG